jgi:hypothetical protein
LGAIQNKIITAIYKIVESRPENKHWRGAQKLLYFDTKMLQQHEL